MTLKAINDSQRRTVAERVRVCRSFFSRLVGLLGVSHISPDEACLIRRCSGVHTIGMRFPIDVVFLDAHDRVISVYANIRPNRIIAFRPGAKNVLESAAGAASTRCSVGDLLRWEGSA